MPEPPKRLAKKETLQGEVELNIRVPRALWARVKSAAALQDRPVKYVVADAFTDYVTAYEQQQG